MIRKCIITDIDGTLLEQYEHFEQRLVEKRQPVKSLPGTLEKFVEWDRKGYSLVLITARRESSRAITEKQLEELGIFYDALVMGVGTGPRVLINDLKPETDVDMAVAINLKRNQGIGEIDV